MENKEKTPWRKNLDKRYISGEDLLNGEAMGKGLKREMVVTIVSWKDSPTFDKKKNEEVDKTALYLREYPSGKMLYKPVILNVINGKFLSKEIGGGSDFIDDFDTTKPVVLYACPDKIHGHVARFKKYIPSVTDPSSAIDKLNQSTTLAELSQNWGSLSTAEKNIDSVIKRKDELKQKFSENGVQTH